jgi:hypothetical protein
MVSGLKDSTVGVVPQPKLEPAPLMVDMAIGVGLVVIAMDSVPSLSEV